MILGQTFHTPYRVDFDLLDAGGVVHHPKYLVICERARALAMAEVGLPVEKIWQELNVAFAVVEMEARYHKALRWGMQLEILLEVVEMGSSWLWVRHVFREVEEAKGNYFSNGLEVEKPLFEAKLRLVTIDLTRFKAVRLPEQVALRLRAQKA